MLQNLSDWLSSTSLNATMAGPAWIVPTVQTLHILAIGVLMASVVMLDLKLVGLAGRNLSVEATSRRFIPWIWGALAVLLPTGIVLIIIEPSRELLNFAFQTKMVLVLVVVAITAWLQMHLKAGQGASGAARIAAAVSLLLWLVIITCGRWIAYV